MKKYAALLGLVLLGDVALWLRDAGHNLWAAALIGFVVALTWDVAEVMS